MSSSEEETSTPIPPDWNTTWTPPADMTRPLSAFQEEFVLSACPAGTRILLARFHRTVRLPCPIWVTVALPDGEERKLILRMDYIVYGVEREAAVLPTLARIGLPVPEILAGPVIDPTQQEAGPMTLLSVLPGQDLLSWAWNAPRADVRRAIRFILEGVAMQHGATEALSREPAARQLPHRTLRDELQEVLARSGPWLAQAVFQQAVEVLSPLVERIQTPLAFSSGDYNQGNFLFEGERLTGLIDFSGACFEDPHIGMAMYWIYAWYPFNQEGIIERYLEQRQLTFADFAPRLALRCLRTLQEQIQVSGGEDRLDEDGFETPAQYRGRVLGYLQHALDTLGEKPAH